MATGALCLTVITGSGTAGADALCDQLRAQYGPGWPCVSVPTPPPTPDVPTPAPALPGQEESVGGPQAGANPGPGPGVGNGTPIVPVPKQPPTRSETATAPPARQDSFTRAESPNPPTQSASHAPAPQSGPPPPPAATDPNPVGDTTSPAAVQQSNDPPNNDDIPLPALALASAALFAAVRPRALRNTVDMKNYSGEYGTLPGTPIPRDPSAPGVSNAFGTARIIPGQGAKAGFVDPDMTSALAQKWGAPITIDPDAPGATGPYSGNLIQPDPLTGNAGIGLPGWNEGGNGTRKPGSLNIDAVKGAKLRIVEAQPVSLSTVNYGGLPELVVNYQFTYQVQYTYTFVNSAVQWSSYWADVSLDEVATLQGMGVTVPKIN